MYLLKIMCSKAIYVVLTGLYGMLSSLPFFPALCWPAIPTSHHVFYSYVTF